MKKIISVILALTMLISVLTSCGSATMADINKNTNIVVATIGGEDIYAYEMIYLMKMGATKEEALEEFQFMKALIAKAKEYGIELTEEDKASVDAQWDEVVAQYENEEAFVKEIENVGITKEQYKEIMLMTTVIDKFYGQFADLGIIAEVTDDEVLDFYDANFLRSQHILFSTVDDNQQPLSEQEKAKKKAKAEEVIAKIKAGADFEDFLSLSEDPGAETSPDGYTFLNTQTESIKNNEIIAMYLQQYGIPTMVEPFETGTINTNVGLVSDIVESDFGYHIIKRLDLHGQGNQYEEVKSVISYVLTSIGYDAVIEGWKTGMKQSTNKYYEALEVEPAQPLAGQTAPQNVPADDAAGEEGADDAE